MISLLWVFSGWRVACGRRAFTFDSSHFASYQGDLVRARSVVKTPSAARLCCGFGFGLRFNLRLLSGFTFSLPPHLSAVGDLGEELANLFDFFYCPDMHLKTAQIDLLRGGNLSLLHVSGERSHADPKFSCRLPG